MKVMVGIGCDRDVSLQTLQTALTQALQQCGLQEAHIAGLASIDKKHDEVALLQLAAKKQWSIAFYPAAQLAVIPVPNPSAVVQHYMGTPSVSEAAAIIAAKTDMQHLLIEKHKYLGMDGKNATISIASVST
ncbi:MAG: cobalamin biosynthesis protein [Methylococcaceae bacterium]|nr:cobalamin biosynthesis protein [Methylococcaceae bacterium]